MSSCDRDPRSLAGMRLEPAAMCGLRFRQSDSLPREECETESKLLFALIPITDSSWCTTARIIWCLPHHVERYPRALNLTLRSFPAHKSSMFNCEQTFPLLGAIRDVLRTDRRSES